MPNTSTAFLGILTAITISRKFKPFKGQHMKALIISSLVFFSLRAMSGEVGQQSSAKPCLTSIQSNRELAPKLVSQAPAAKEASSKTRSR